MPITKKLRFEIFKRDMFTCQYCGQRPPDVVLELDHIEPRASNGSDDEINLITSCFDCNRGKAHRKLGEIHPRPDADIKYLEAQQEIAEAKRYLEASKIKEQVRTQLQERLEEIWARSFDTDMVPIDRQWQAWLNQFAPEEVEKAIKITQPLFQRKPHMQTGQLIRYVSGVLWGVRRQEQSNV